MPAMMHVILSLLIPAGRQFQANYFGQSINMPTADFDLSYYIEHFRRQLM
jgi:hypothetical protein